MIVRAVVASGATIATPVDRMLIEVGERANGKAALKSDTDRVRRAAESASSGRFASVLAGIRIQTVTETL